MTVRTLAAVSLLLFSSLAWAQSEPPQTPPPTAGQTQSGAGSVRGSTPQSGAQTGSETQKPSASGCPGAGDMQTDVAQMQKNLEELRTAVNKMDDGPARDASLANVKMWEGLVGHMKKMSDTMAGGGCGHMMHQPGMSGAMAERPRGARRSPKGPMGSSKTTQPADEGKRTPPRSEPRESASPVEP